MSDEEAIEHQVDWVAIAVTLFSIVWASWYVWSTLTNPEDEAEAAWLITPILMGLWICGSLVVKSAMGVLPDRLKIDPSDGLGVPSRYRFVLSLPILAVLIWACGFILATIIYLPTMFVLLGEKRPAILAAITGAVLAVIYFGLVLALSVNLPLWPRGM